MADRCNTFIHHSHASIGKRCLKADTGGTGRSSSLIGQEKYLQRVGIARLTVCNHLRARVS